MSENNKIYFSTKFSSLIGDGGGHSCKSAKLEGLDNSKDAFKKTNVVNPVIIIALSFVRNVLAIFDNATGTEDIRTPYGCGEISKKSDDCMGKKMTGCIAADLYFVPETIMYYSFNRAFQIPLQFAKLDVKKMCEILNEEPNMRLADAKFNDNCFEVQAKKNLKTLHVDYMDALKNSIDNHPAICGLIDSKAPMFGKIIIGGEGNKRFGSLEKDFEKTINEILQSYNEPIRRGLEIQVINIDNNGSTQIFNAETAKAYHILGTDSVVADPTQGIAVFESPDFGLIDLNRVHCFEISKFNDNAQIVVDYKNFGKKIKCDEQLTELQGPELADYEDRKNNDQIPKTTCRAYIACLSKTERDIQTKSIKCDADELRKISVGINTGDGIRILARLDYPADWPGVAPRNLKNVGIVLCFNGEDTFLSLSANKSNITWSNIDSSLLNVLKDTILKIIKQYNYAIWKSDNGESRILASRDKFITALGVQVPAVNIQLAPAGNQVPNPNPNPNPVPLPQPPQERAVSKRKQEVLDAINEMDDEEIENKKRDINDIIKGNLDKIDADTAYSMLKFMLENVDNNPIIKNGCKLFN